MITPLTQAKWVVIITPKDKSALDKMQQIQVPEALDPHAWAKQNRHFKGLVPLAMMPRLTSYLEADDNEVQVQVQFAKDPRGNSVITGSISGDFQLKCQRCFSPVNHSVVAELFLCVIDSEANLDTVPDGFDPHIVEVPGSLSLLDLIEDEIILNLPLVPRHKTEECQLDQGDRALLEGIEAKAAKVNPFDVLKSLKTTA